MRLHNVSIHRNFYQNQFINEYTKKIKAKISESRSHGVPESRSFRVRYRRTYVLNKLRLKKERRRTREREKIERHRVDIRPMQGWRGGDGK